MGAHVFTPQVVQRFSRSVDCRLDRSRSTHVMRSSFSCSKITLALAPFLHPNAKVVFVASRLGEIALESMSEHNRTRLTAPTTVLKVPCV